MSLEPGSLHAVDACRQRLAEHKSASVAELDSSAISVLSWNIKKGELSECYAYTNSNTNTYTN